MATIGQRVRAARERRVWTQEDLARESGVPVITLSRIENDHHSGRPRVSTVRKLAAALAVEAAWLLFGEDAAALDQRATGPATDAGEREGGAS